MTAAGAEQPPVTVHDLATLLRAQGANQAHLLEQLTDLVENALGGRGHLDRSALEDVADRLVRNFADELARRSPSARPDQERMHAYDMMRRQFAGPYDEEASPLSAARLVSFFPRSGPAHARVTLSLKNAAQPVQVAFSTGHGGESVAAEILEVNSPAAGGIWSVTAAVPEAAADGPITVELTDGGSVTSPYDFLITTGPTRPSRPATAVTGDSGTRD
ncbi:hypothetical protein [Kitasatospora sp. NPDC004289]